MVAHSPFFEKQPVAAVANPTTGTHVLAAETLSEVSGAYLSLLRRWGITLVRTNQILRHPGAFVAMRLPAIDVREGGYYIQRPRSGKRLTNFIIVPVSQGGMQTPLMYQLFQNGKSLGTVEISEAAWASRAKFLAVLQGIGNLGFFGYGPDLGPIKAFVLSGSVPIDEIQST